VLEFPSVPAVCSTGRPPDSDNTDLVFSVPDFSTLTRGRSAFENFNISVYDSDSATKDFHERIIKLYRQIVQADSTTFHAWLSSLATKGQLVRLWTQNVDGIEEKFENLSASKKPEAEPFPRTIRLHGTLTEMVCQQNKEHCFKFDPQAFTESKPRDCPSCADEDRPRTNRTRPPKRLSACLIGKIRPNITLYGESEEGLDIVPILRQDFSAKRSPDCILVAGTRLKTPGARRLLGQICRNAKAYNRACLIVYINKEQRSLGTSMDSWIDYRVEGDCQLFAKKALQWDCDGGE
jgi:NAD-dependent histone deacetylase SIR2